MGVPYANTIVTSAAEYDIPPSVLAGLLQQESGFIPTAVNTNANGSLDRGIAQINSAAHPNVSDAQAYDPAYAIPWAAKYLAGLIKSCGSVAGGLSRYNTGMCGSSTGQAYAAKVLAYANQYTSLDSGGATQSAQVTAGMTAYNPGSLESALVKTGKTATGILHPVGTMEVILQYGAGIVIGLLLIAGGIFVATKGGDKNV